MMAPLLDGQDADAVRTRLTADAEWSRLEAVSEYALNPTANARVKLAYCSAPEQPDISHTV